MIKLLLAGDFYPSYRVTELLNEKRYNEILGEIEPLVKDSDYSIINLECPIVLNSAIPIKKIGPNLKCNINTLEALKHTGFSMTTLANNHFYDYGEKGVSDTLKMCQKYKIDVVGGGKNLQEAQKINYKEIKGEKIAFLNFCEHEFSIATTQTGGSNPLNLIENFYQIQDAVNNADYVIVIIHGGHEHYQLPSPRMQKTYRFFIDAGADAIINHHQHCYSGYEIFKGKPIFYGIGNFSFDKEGYKNSNWNKGYLVSLHLKDKKISFKTIPYIQGDKKAGIILLKNKNKENIQKDIKQLNVIINDDSLLLKHFTSFAKSRRRKNFLLFEPYNNRFTKALRIRRLLPSFISNKKLLQIRNYIACEAHRDILIDNITK